MNLLDARALESSSVVANCAMNRERRLEGSGGYCGELGLDVLAFLRERALQRTVTWTDWCCGSARALLDAAGAVATQPSRHAVRIEGIDLAGMFAANPQPGLLTLRVQTIEEWAADEPRALITCVHGLHYVGDKLAAIAKAAGSLAPDGVFIAHLDLANIRHADGRPASRAMTSWLRVHRIAWDSRRRLLKCTGPRDIATLPRYLGADDTAGPNCTGQPAVASHYEL